MLPYLLKLYPYTPSITYSGNIDPQSIHSKTSEKALSFLTGALACAPSILKNKTISWVLLEFGVVSCISLLFWSKLGHWITNKIADQICIQHFLRQDPISAEIGNRVTNNDDLRAEIFEKISSACSNDNKKKDALLEHYLVGIWPRLPITQLLSCYKETVKQMTHPSMTSFKPTPSSQMHIWTLHHNELDLETIDLLKKNFNIDVEHEGETPFSTLAQEAINHQENDKKWRPILNKMLLLHQGGCALKLTFDHDFVRIYENSSLGVHLQTATDNVALSLKTYLSPEKPLIIKKKYVTNQRNLVIPYQQQ